MSPLVDVEVERYVLSSRIRVLDLAARGWRLRYEGEDGMGCLDHPRRNLRVIHSVARENDGEVWAHFSLSRRDRKMPSWEQTRDAFREVMGSDALGVVVIPPTSEHVDIAEVSHVWCCLTKRALPDFTRGGGSI